MRFLPLLTLCAATLIATQGANLYAEDYAEALTEIRDSYEQELAQINQRYLTGLNKLANAYTVRKKLDAALAVNREIKAIQSGGRLTHLPGDAPPELIKARKQYAALRKSMSDAAQQKKAALDGARKSTPLAAAKPASATPANKEPTVIKLEVDEVDKKAAPATGVPAPFTLNPNRSRGPDSDFFREEVWDQDRVIRSGSYRMKDMISITNQPGPTVTVEAGTIIKDGVLFVGQGTLEADGVFFEDQRIHLDLGGFAHFENCYLKESVQAKAGRWVSVALYSGRWTLRNCVIEKSFFERWGSYTVGVEAEYCTFNSIDFPDFNYYNEVYKEATSGKLALNHCRFVRCDIPVSMLLFTRNCVFERCKFIDRKLNKPQDAAIQVSIHVVDQITKIPELDEKIRLDIHEGNLEDAGAKLTLQK